jgi:hypothetical protein
MPGKRRQPWKRFRNLGFSCTRRWWSNGTEYCAPLGTQALAEREQWLNKVGALKDEWIIERRVQLLIDKGEIQNARQLLLSVPFQKVHQTYTRTGMWLQVCEKLREACDPIPEILGEDRLARFGAYREFQQLPHEPATEIADPKPDNW